jgi:diguanylate cyclase (GGDEF)-like protein
VVETLERVNADHPTLRAHQLVLQAVGCDGRGEEERAEEALEAAGRLARRHDNPWVLFEVARHRARRLAGRGAEALAVTQAEIAAGIAGRQGWGPRRRSVEREFQLTDGGSPMRRGSGGSRRSRGASGEDLQTLQLQRHLDAMLRVSLAATEAADPDEQIEFVLDELIAILNAERGAVFLRDDEGSLQLAAARHAGRSDLVDPTLSRQAVDRVDETGEPLVMAATAAGDAEGLMTAESVMAEDIRSIGAVPLVDEEESAGVVYLDSRLASGIFSDLDIDILAALAGQIPVILQRLRAARLETQVESERQQRRLADRLRRMTTEMHATRHLPDICRLLVDGLAEFLPVAGARAFVCREEQTREVVIPEAADASGDGTRFPERKSIEELGDCDLESLFNGLGLGAFDFEGTDSETVISPHGWQMAIPLQTSDALAGILLVEATAGEAFEESARRFAMAFGGQAGVALEHARLVTTDELTGLHNRRNFFELARREFRKMRRYEFSLTALMFDIDEFKAVNDTHGHAAGDEVLRAVAACCRQCVRSVDILGRYGGEEFALLLPHTEAAEATETVAERIRAAVEAETVVVDGTEISVTVSVGVAGADPDDETLDDLLERADAALYRAKDEGRNRVVVQAGR